MLVARDCRSETPSGRLEGVLRMNEILPHVLAQVGLCKARQRKRMRGSGGR